jgi:hypothetical protein
VREQIGIEVSAEVPLAIDVRPGAALGYLGAWSLEEDDFVWDKGVDLSVDRTDISKRMSV